MSFIYDLKQGEKIEQKFIELLNDTKKYYFITKLEGNFKYFDILAIKPNGQIDTFEIKYDRQWNRTGNVALEYLANDKSGSIMTSKSKYIVYYLDAFYFTRTNILKNWIIRDEICKYVKGGDGKRQTLILIPLKLFKSLFNKID